MIRRYIITTAAVAIAMAIGPMAPAQSIRYTDDRRPESDTGTVVGIALAGDNTPVTGARIRLRDVTGGQVVGETKTNTEGRFQFLQIVPRPYVAELVSDDQKVLALSELFSVTRGDTVATVIRLRSRSPWFSGFFGNAAAAAIAAASGLGLTSVGSSGLPASPQ